MPSSTPLTNSTEPSPAAAVINEALEIAGRFSGEGSVEFVNGVLDGIRKTLPPQEPQSK